MRNLFASVLVTGVLVCFSHQPVAAMEPAAKWDDVPRIIAVGDVHGAYDTFVTVLKSARLVDEQLSWIGGPAHLVQTGDVLDRGPDSKKCMDLLMELEEQAARAGGRVHALVGNHEAMNILGILDYVSKEEFASYADTKAVKRWEKDFESYYQKQKKKAKGGPLPSIEDARELFQAEKPLGYREHRRAFDRGGRYGRWILEHNASVRINGIVFSHGDWSKELSALGIDTFNRRVREELSGRSSGREPVAFNPKSPLQYRGLAQVPLRRSQQENQQAEVDRILKNLRATRMVVGHTVTKGVIEPRFGGKHISIDTGMLELYRGGHQVALEIVGDDLNAIHPLGKVSLPDYLDESTIFDYLEAVAPVDTQNVDVFTQLAARYLGQRNPMAARDTLEHLFTIPKPIPVHHHEELGNIYRELGETEKAQQQFLAYVEGVRKVIASTPDKARLVRLLNRFCAKHNMKLDGWECSECAHSCRRTR